MKLFDVEQFLMLTLALATAGAVGVGVYSTREDDPSEAPATEAKPAASAEEAFPEAEPEPLAASTSPAVSDPRAASSAPGIAGAPMPSLDAGSAGLDELPGPQVEDVQW